MNDIDINDLVARYIALRNKKMAMEKLLSDKLEPLNIEMSQIESKLGEFLKFTNQDSAKTASGTVYKSVLMTATVVDMQSFLDFVLSKKAYDLLEKRVNKTAVKLYLDDEIIVSGVKIDHREKINIRK